jgi:DNA-binding SARP family transcriptional activator
LNLLGRSTVFMPDGTEATAVLRQRKRFALLVYLCTHRRRDAHSWSELAEVFWPDSDPRRARNSLRQTIHYLRQHLGDRVIVRNHDLSVSVGSDALRTDVDDFLDAAAEELWGQALSLYTGEFMTGFALPLTEAFDAWLLEERDALQQAAAICARRLADDSEVSGDLNAATLRWRQVAALSPTNEAVVSRVLRNPPAKLIPPAPRPT